MEISGGNIFKQLIYNLEWQDWMRYGFIWEYDSRWVIIELDQRFMYCYSLGFYCFASINEMRFEQKYNR